MAYCFISDLHLHEGRQDLKRAFFSFLEEKVTKADKLYILGDLFETWIGDDDNSPFVAEVIDALQKANDSTDIFFMHGNRDFLLGEKFAEKCGAKLISDPFILNKEEKKLCCLMAIFFVQMIGNIKILKKKLEMKNGRKNSFQKT